MVTWNTTATEVTWTAVDDPSVTWTVQLNPTVTGGGGAVDSVNGETGVVVLDVDDVDGRDIYRPALVMSPTSVTTFGGSMVNGVSLTIAALAGSIPTGLDILIWNGTNGGAPNGSYTHAGGGTFNYSARQYLNATSFNNGCVEVSSNDYATTNADGEISRWAITTTNGTDYGLVATGGQAFRLTYGPSSYTNGRPALFDTTDGKWLKEGSAIGGDLASAVDAASARTSLGLGTSATYDVGTGTSNVITGNDSRLTDARTPSVGGSNDDFMQRKSGAWTNRTIAQVRTDLATSWVRIADRTIAAGGSASENFDVTGYTIVQILFAGASERNSAQAGLYCTFNGDTSSVYSTSASVLTNQLILGTMPGNSTNTDRFGFVRADLHLFNGFIKTGTSLSTNLGSTATMSSNAVTREFFSTITGAVTSIQISTQAADIAAGSRIIVLGM